MKFIDRLHFSAKNDKLSSGIITRTQRGVYFGLNTLVKHTPFRIVVIRLDDDS